MFLRNSSRKFEFMEVVILYAGLSCVWVNVVWQTTGEAKYNVVTNFTGFVA
jgi:hypothetical protein